MTDELQNGSIDSDESLEAENLDSNEQGAELATDSETQHEPKAEADVNQDAVQKAINKQHAKYREEERKRLEAEQQLKEYQEREQQQRLQQINQIPEYPDELDDDFDEKVKQYHKAVQEKALYDAQVQIQNQYQLQQQQQEQAKKQQEFEQKAKNYEDRAKDLGISQTEVQATGQILVNSGISEVLAEALLDDPEGPLIAKHLSSNLADLEALQNGNPLLAGAKLIEIKQKAQALKPKTSNTPPPATKVDQQAVDPEAGMLKHAKGGSFE